jgi:hypothetical protein
MRGSYWPKAAIAKKRNEYWQSLGGWSSNLSFTATFRKRKPLIFLEKIGGLWFLVRGKWPYGTDLGQMRFFGAEKTSK